MRTLLLLLLLLPLVWPARAQSAPDTLIHDSFRYDQQHPNWSNWAAETTDRRVTELTAEGYHVRYTGSDATGSMRLNRTFRLNDQQDYSLELKLRLRGRGGLLWGYIDGTTDGQKTDYLLLELELDRPTPQVALWHLSGKWSKLFSQDLPAGFDVAAAHTLRVGKTSTGQRFYLDGQEVGTPQPAAVWPGADHDIGLFLENAGSEMWARQLLFRHHSLIRLAPGVPRVLQRERLPDGVNTPGEELRARVSADGRWLYFTRSMGKPEVPQESNTDIFVSERDATGTWEPARNLGPVVNSDINDSFAYVAPDGQSLVVKRRNKGNGRTGDGLMLVSRKPDGSWEWAQDYPAIPSLPNSVFTDRCLDASGNVLLLAGDIPGKPDADLYVSLRQPDGSWSPLQLLTSLNTMQDEASPMLAPDGRTMYFSSAGHPGYGSNDIFVTRRLDDTWLHWSEPLNLGPGVNTRSYENHFSIAADGSFAYLTAREPGSTTYQTDFYRLKLPPALRPKPTQLVRGRILDARTRQPVAGAQVRYEQLPDGRQAGQVLAAAGTFEIVLPAGQQYGFRAEAPGYVAASDNLDLRNGQAGAEVSRDLYLLPVAGLLASLQMEEPKPAPGDTTILASLRLKPAAVPDSKPTAPGTLAALQLPEPSAAAVAVDAPRLVLHNVFFEQGKPVLLPASYPELKRLAGTLRANPTLRIRLEGHTDNQGPADKNQLLSEQRVAEIKKYLIRQQVAAERLATIGYGPSRPVAPNDTEEHRRQNRRVEFAILQR